jgi:outer membrane immunogenic protein
MKIIALQTTAISLLLAGSAVAADVRMPVKAPPPAPVAVYSWTGCYVGAGGGYGMFRQRQSWPAVAQQGWDNGGSGWFGTVQAGCDYQVNASIVIGAFGDYDFSGIKGNATTPVLLFSAAEEKLRSSWAAGGRIGWLPWSTRPFLVYVSGGYTQARFGQADYRFLVNGVPTGNSISKHTYDGWFIGGGYEYGLTFLPGLFWKTEYRFADYGRETVALIVNGPPATNDFHNYVHTVRSELVWRFNWSGATAAAYAADVRALPVKAAPASVAAYSWTGCYVGAGGGYGLFRQKQSWPAIAQGAWDNGGSGWFGTVQAGCDYQVNANIVVGAFGDYDFSRIKATVINGLFPMVAEEKLRSSWAAGGRIGWLPWSTQQFLVYASGGYTEARFGRADYLLFPGQVLAGFSIPKHTYDAWFIGSGYEYGLTFLPGLFWKTEYRFADSGKETLRFLDAQGAPTATTNDFRKYIHTVRSEIVWRFNFGGPVVARY